MKTLLKLQTHLAKIRQQDLTATESVQQILGWTQQQYCEHQFEQYEAFIARICQGYPGVCQQLRYSATFRGFWNNEWAIRNEIDFLPFAVESNMDDADILDEYFFINNHCRLINDDCFMLKYGCVLNLIKA